MRKLTSKTLKFTSKTRKLKIKSANSKIDTVVGVIFSLLIIFFVILVPFLYKRYVPVKNIPCQKNEEQDAILLDIRAYNHKRDNVDKEVLNIPFAYLKRFNEEIPHENIHVIASDKLEVNLGLRFLSGKGIKVTSYEISDCVCK